VCFLPYRVKTRTLKSKPAPWAIGQHAKQKQSFCMPVSLLVPAPCLCDKNSQSAQGAFLFINNHLIDNRKFSKTSA
jgi:hypothetical protein